MSKTNGQRATVSEEPAVADFHASDEVLLAHICQGDDEALTLLFRRYARLVRAVAFRVLGDPSEADDLLQDIFLLIHRKCANFDSAKGPARFWILRMTYYRAVSRRRYLDSRHFYIQVNLEDAAKELPDPRTITGGYADSIDGVLGNGSLERMFQGLSENQRRTLQLHFVEGYSLDEIATELGQSRGNVKHHYFRGLENLRKHIFGSKIRGDCAV
jgi:RNA polymerase sigma-70 factor (ECF subfamily)